MCTTTDLKDFSSYERKKLIRLLQAWDEQGLPEDFEESNVHAMLNIQSGDVFLTNEEYQVAMLDGNDLKMWYHCFNCGNEGFEDECKLNDEGCNECNKQEEEEEEE